MPYKDPKAITEAGTATGAKKEAGSEQGAARRVPRGRLHRLRRPARDHGLLGLDPERWGTLPTLFTGAVFTVGLMLVVIAGSELLTGNMALVPLALMQGKIKVKDLIGNFTWVLAGNLLGALFVAYFLGVQSGVLTADLPFERLSGIAHSKGIEETEWQIFLRALGCNWLVCLAVWMALAADDVTGKILAIFFPIMAFVAMGFDHVIANMFFLPAAMFAGVADLTWWDVIHNWIFAFIGNLVGAAVFVAGSYYYLYGRDEEEAKPGDTPRQSRSFERDGAERETVSGRG